MKYIVFSLIAAAVITISGTHTVHAQVIDTNVEFNWNTWYSQYLESLKDPGNPNSPYFNGTVGENYTGNHCGCSNTVVDDKPWDLPTPTLTPTLTPTPIVTPTPTPTPTATPTPTPTPAPSPTASPTQSAPVLSVLPATGAGNAAWVVSGLLAALIAFVDVALLRK